MSNERDNTEQNSSPLNPLERTLASFAPAAAQIDRDRLMFLAGQASALASGGREAPGLSDLWSNHGTGKLTLPARHAESSRSRWLWPASTAALAATSLALAAALILRPARQQLIVVHDRPAVTPTIAPPHVPRTESIAASPAVNSIMDAAASRSPTDNYIRTRDVALRMGLDALGGPAAFSDRLAVPTYRDLMEGAAAAGRSSAVSASPGEIFSNM